jgi:hypothetical protein
MKKGYLSDYFAGVGVKRLTGTEVDPKVSRGHEFQGVASFQRFLGQPVGREVLTAKYVWLSDDDTPLSFDSSATWYDSRKKKSHRDPEPRFYYPAESNPIVQKASDGDTLFVCLSGERQITFLLCRGGSAIEQQLLWLFGLSLQGKELVQRDLSDDALQPLGFAARYVLELIGIDAFVEDDEWLDRLIAKFGDKFPKTNAFSEFARKAVRNADIVADPDAALLSWLELEERLFRTFEKHLVSERLSSGFVNGGNIDVDGFMQFSLSVQNRRKSRAGYSLENHLGYLFDQRILLFQRGGNTEGRKKPDFLFPGSEAYHDPGFPRELLTLLGSKSTCKDRWRQVLSEGREVPLKHLITLEPGISAPQTAEMKAESLQLVLPANLHGSYLPQQRDWLMSVADFIELVEARQVQMQKWVG